MTNDQLLFILLPYEINLCAFTAPFRLLYGSASLGKLSHFQAFRSKIANISIVKCNLAGFHLNCLFFEQKNCFELFFEIDFRIILN